MLGELFANFLRTREYVVGTLGECVQPKDKTVAFGCIGTSGSTDQRIKGSKKWSNGAIICLLLTGGHACHGWISFSFSLKQVDERMTEKRKIELFNTILFFEN